ncbi:MAG: threonylcarbamoyl-AMP synthase [Treponema sp.]|nr:threonylcarbamoyl-AMP synthase [Treponema sp.]
MRLLPLSEENIRLAAEALRQGSLVAFPTETVYGLGADAFNVSALAKVFAAKRRPRFDPLIIHIARLQDLEQAADLSALDRESREKTRALGLHLWPGPLTLILPKRPEVPDLATSGLPSVAVRFPDHPAAQRLILLSTGALAAPSANLFGCLSPTRAEHVRDQLGGEVAFILDGGPTRVGVESTVLDLCSGPPRILRPGGSSRERIEAVIGPVEFPVPGEGPASSPGGLLPSGHVRSPGQLKGHYAPRTPLLLYRREGMLGLADSPLEGFLFFDGPSRDAWFQRAGRLREGRRLPGESRIRTLSEGGNMNEAAANLFDLLHRLDRLGLCRIRAEEVPETGLGAAVNDRLRRAAAGSNPEKTGPGA